MTLIKNGLIHDLVNRDPYIADILVKDGKITLDEIVIDITGDQFKYKEPKFTAPVYVGIRANGFHDQFKLDDQIFCSLYEDPFSGDFDLDRRYQRIMAYYEED